MMNLRAVAAFVAAVLAAPPGDAHSKIVRIELPSAPAEQRTTLTLHFDTPIETRFSRFELEAGGKVRELTVLTRDARAVVVDLQLPLVPSGDATLRWNVLSSDGHREKGTRTVTLGR